MGKILDLAGKRFGRLVVIEYNGLNSRGKSSWLCKCDCGKDHIVQGSYLKSGNIKSCGCLNIHRIKECNTKSGHFKKGSTCPPEYRVWYAMKQRCTNPNDKDYGAYGGRGISVCEKWGNSFDAFLTDMGSRPSKEYSIDRIDVDGNYEPGNCRWVTMKVQGNNRRNNKLITIDGVTDSLMNWTAKIGCVSYDTAKARINYYGWDPYAALTTTVK